MRKSRSGGGLRSFFGIVGTAWAAIFLHSCGAPPGALDPAALGQIHSAPRLRVGLGKWIRVDSAAVVFPEPFVVIGASGILQRESGGPSAVAVAWEDGLRIGNRVHAERSVRLSSGDDAGFELGGIKYRGDLVVFRDDDRETRAPRVTLVNDVDLEDYLRGVVGKEMSLSKGEEALKAQVVAARTYALYESKMKTLATVKGEKFDVYDDERSQVYGGRERETALAARLVDETRGRFVLFKDRLVKTFFSSTCGGHTEPAVLVLGEGEDIPPLRGTACGYCTESKYYSWKAEFSRAELAKKIWGASSVAKVKTVRVTKTLPGGHAQEVGITVEKGVKEHLIEANGGFRRRIDPRLIRSTLWDSIETVDDKIVISGRGWGHGAGMCQYGAYKMADLGKTSDQILAHYFPEAGVKKLY
jgi:stage II sporulation protein D